MLYLLYFQQMGHFFNLPLNDRIILMLHGLVHPFDSQ